MVNPKASKPKSPRGAKPPPAKRVAPVAAAEAPAHKAAKPVAATVVFQTLASLRALLGAVDEDLRAELFEDVPDEDLLADGRRIASDVLVSGVVSYVSEVRASLGALSAAQLRRLVGFDEAMLPLVLDETTRLEALVARAAEEGVTVDMSLAERRALASAATSKGVALRDQGARALRRVLRGRDQELASLDKAVGNAETAASLASGLTFVASTIDAQLSGGTPSRQSLLRRLKLDAAYAHELREAATRVLATDKAASATAETGVSQRSLDLQDGRVMRILDQVNRAFRDANAVDGAITVPKLGELEPYFVNTRRAAVKEVPAPPQPPTG